MATTCPNLDAPSADSRPREPRSALPGRSFAANLSAVVISKAVTVLAGLVTLGYAARTLGPERYGMWALASALVAYATIALSPGLMVWGTRAVAREPQTAGRTLVVVNASQLILAIFAYAAVAIFAVATLADATQRTMVLLAGLTLFTEALSVDWVFAGLERLAISAWIGAGLSAANAAALFLLVRSPRDACLFAALPAACGGTGVVAGCLLLKHRGVRVQWPGPRAIRDALIDSLPLGAAMALVVLLHHANKLIVYGILGAEAAGGFAAAFRLVEVAGMFPAVLGAVFLSRLARMVRQRSDRAAREARLFARVHLLVACLVAAIMAAEAPALVATLFGARYHEAVGAVRILSLAVLFNFAICSQTNCLISYGKDRVMLVVVIVSAVVSIGGGLLLVPWLGLSGAALAVSGVDFAGWLVSLGAYRRAVGRWNLDLWRAPLVAGGLCAAASLMLGHAGVQLYLRASIAATIYAICAWPSIREVLAARIHRAPDLRTLCVREQGL